MNYPMTLKKFVIIALALLVALMGLLWFIRTFPEWFFLLFALIVVILSVVFVVYITHDILLYIWEKWGKND